MQSFKGFFYSKTLPLVPMRALCERFTPFFKLKTILNLLHRELTIIFTERHDLFLAINTYPDLLEQCQRISALTRRFYIVSKVDAMKWKGKSVFFFPACAFVYLPFNVCFSLFFPLLHGLEAAFRSCEIKVKYVWFGANYWLRFHKSSHNTFQLKQPKATNPKTKQAKRK